MYTFPLGEGPVVTVVWSYDGQPHALPVPRGAQVLDVFGNPMPVTGGTIALAAEPIYLLSPPLRD